MFGAENVPRRGREKSCCKNAPLRRRLPRSLNFLFLSAFFVPLFLSFFFPLELCKNERVGLFAFALSLRFCRLAAVSREDGDRRRRSGGGKLQSRHLGVRENQNGVRSLRAHWRTLSLSLFTRSRPQPSMQKRNFILFTSLLRLRMLPGQGTDIFL